MAGIEQIVQNFYDSPAGGEPAQQVPMGVLDQTADEIERAHHLLGLSPTELTMPVLVPGMSEGSDAALQVSSRRQKSARRVAFTVTNGSVVVRGVVVVSGKTYYPPRAVIVENGIERNVAPTAESLMELAGFVRSTTGKGQFQATPYVPLSSSHGVITPQ